MKVKFVDLGKQYLRLKDPILKKIDEISSKGAYVLTEELKEFEKNIASYCETDYGIGVGNGTDALFLVMKALKIGKGDEIITAPNSFIATAGAISATGAKAVFVDVANDLNINTELIEEKISEKTKAIIPVHLAGRPANMDPIKKIAEKHNLKIIEDSAQAIGARYKSKKVGSLGVAGCFSLHPLKNLHVHGDGGFITTNNDEIYDKLIKFRNHGLRNRDECDFFAYNSRLDSIQAAIANIKLKYVDEWNKRHREIAEIYRQGLKDYVTVPIDKDFEKPVYHNFIIQTEKRDDLQAYLLKKGIETKVHYPIPIHLQKAASYLGYKKGDFPVCERQAQTTLSLPIYPELKDEQINLVIQEIKSWMI